MNFNLNISEESANKAMATVVNADLVKTIAAYAEMNPDQMSVRIQYYDNMLILHVKMHVSNIWIDKTSPATEKLLQALIDVMSNNPEAIKEYAQCDFSEEEIIKEDIRIELFKQFANSTVSAYVQDEFVSNAGEHYLPVSFNLGYKRAVRFCLPKTQEVDELLLNSRRLDKKED